MFQIVFEIVFHFGFNAVGCCMVLSMVSCAIFNHGYCIILTDCQPPWVTMRRKTEYEEQKEEISENVFFVQCSFQWYNPITGIIVLMQLLF